MLEYAVRAVLNRTAQRRFGVLDPLKVVIDELARRAGRGDGGRQQPGGPGGRARVRCRSGASCGSSTTTSWRSRRRSSSGSPRVARCACGTPTSSPATRSSRTRPARHRAPLHLRPGDAGRRRARRPQGQGDAPLGRRRPTRCRPRSACTTTCSRRPDPGAGGDLFDDLNPASETIVKGACRAGPRRRAPGRDRPVRAARLLHAGPRLAPATSCSTGR